MTNLLIPSLAVLPAMLLAACAAKVNDASRVSSSSAAGGVAVRSSSRGGEQAPMRIPQGAGGQLAKKQLVLFMDVKNVDQTKEPEFKIQEGALKIANIELESLMPRMKRFRVYAVQNQGAQQMARLLSESGEMDSLPVQSLPPPDLYLNVTLTFNVEKAELSGKQKQDAVFTMTSVREYKASLFYSLTDSKGQVLTEMVEASGTITDRADGEPNLIRKNIGEALNSKNEIIYRGAFNPTDPDNQATVVRELVANLQTGLAARLAVACPLTAKVTALNPSATRFSLEKGSSNGVFSGGRVVVWVDDGSFSYCLAETEAEPTVDRANLNVLRWNEGDPDALPIITKLKADPSTIKGYQVWGTTTDIPLKEMLKPQ